MANMAELKRKLKEHTAALYNEGYLDDQFKNLQQMQDADSPDLVAEVVDLFFRDFQRIILDINTTLNHIIVDFQSLDAYAFQLKGSSMSFGAPRLQRASVGFLDHCDQQDIQGCFNSLPQVMNEYDLLKSKLETMFKLEKQIAGFC